MFMTNENKATGGPQAFMARYIHYANIKIKFSASADPGMVTTAITMADRGDEIDW